MNTKDIRTLAEFLLKYEDIKPYIVALLKPHPIKFVRFIDGIYNKPEPEPIPDIDCEVFTLRIFTSAFGSPVSIYENIAKVCNKKEQKKVLERLVEIANKTENYEYQIAFMDLLQEDSPINADLELWGENNGKI